MRKRTRILAKGASHFRLPQPHLRVLCGTTSHGVNADGRDYMSLGSMRAIEASMQQFTDRCHDKDTEARGESGRSDKPLCRPLLAEGKMAEV